MALAARAFWGNKGRSSKPRDNSRYNSSGPRQSEPRVRNCYNCGNTNHFIADCPFENKEDNGGRLVRKDKPKFSPNKNFGNKNFANKNLAKKPQARALVTHEEYPSGDEEEEEESSEVVGVASIAIASTPTTSTSLFNSPNENKVTKSTCLMAKATAVTPSSSKPLSSPSPSLLNDMESLTVNKEVVAFDSFLSNMHGETKVHVEALLDRLGEVQALLEEKENKVIELQGHSRDYADEICSLSQELEKEQELHMTLEESYGNL